MVSLFVVILMFYVMVVNIMFAVGPFSREVRDIQNELKSEY